MTLRKLQMKDAPLMLEWMHDDMVVRFLRGDFVNKTEADCLGFISSAQDEEESIHLAIVNDQDEYMGTVSLKHIQGDTAELGIALRACAMGKDYAFYGLKEILEYGSKNRGINSAYWCVDPENHRALRFYEKHGFRRCNPPALAFYYTDEEKNRFIWYSTGNEKL